MRESNRVEELNLDQGVLRVNIEVDVHHDVKDDYQAENDII